MKELSKKGLDSMLIRAILEYPERIELKKRFEEINKERDKILHSPEIAAADVKLTLVKRADLTHVSGFQGNALPVSDDTIRAFLNESDEDQAEDK